jgi:hypothetical protein
VSNLISGQVPAANARTRSAEGIALPAAAAIAQPRSTSGMAGCRRAYWASDAFGYRLPAASLNVALGQRKPDPAKQYPHTTRIAAAASGGEVGPHPPREPA